MGEYLWAALVWIAVVATTIWFGLCQCCDDTSFAADEDAVDAAIAIQLSELGARECEDRNAGSKECLALSDQSRCFRRPYASWIERCCRSKT
jgi:hypothetical protein